MRTVYTVGYGGRSLRELVDLLVWLGVETVVDVRRWTTSRRLPEFSSKNLMRALHMAGLGYVWMPELGGYRRFGVDVEDRGVAKCFESDGFRAYATYITASPSVKSHLERLVGVVSSRTSALLCRERYPWLCHRKILSDFLVARGFRVVHVIEKDRFFEHRLSKCASVLNGDLVYTW